MEKPKKKNMKNVDTVLAAVMHGDIAAIVDVFAINQKIDGKSLLHHAIESRCSEQMLEFLLQNDADVTCTDAKDGSTPLHFAATVGNVDIVNLLLNHKADVTAHNFDGFTPLHEAALAGKAECCLSLIQRNADINAISNFENSPLHCAVKSRQIQVVRCMIDNNASMDAKNMDGNTALHLACIDNNVEIAKVLLTEGGDVQVSLLNENHQTPLHCTDNQEIIECIRDSFTQCHSSILVKPASKI